MSTQASAPSLVVRTGEGERSLAAGRVYLVGRDPHPALGDQTHC